MKCVINEKLCTMQITDTLIYFLNLINMCDVTDGQIKTGILTGRVPQLILNKNRTNDE